MNTPVFGSTDYWLARTRTTIARFDTTLRERGYQLDPDLPIIADLSSNYCYYDPDRRVLSMGYPDLHQLFGRMRWMTYLPLLGADDVEEVALATDLLLPVFAVHEAAHHLRHRHGRMDRDDSWTEEHAANTLTIAYLRTLPHWPAELPVVLAVLDRMRRSSERLYTCEHADALTADVVDARSQQRHDAARAYFRREYGVDFMASTIMAVALLQAKIVDHRLPSLSTALMDLLGPPR